MATTKRGNEIAQKSADAYIEMAQILERQAKIYRETARFYRSGDLGTNYANLPADAGDHMRHPAQRAIDGIEHYSIQHHCERLRAELASAR